MKKLINEDKQMRKMLKTINLIKEQNDPQYQNYLNNRETHNNNAEQSEDFNIDGEHIVIHSSKSPIELSDEVRTAFQQTKDEFTQQVTDIIELNPMHVYEKDVEWSGKLTKFHLEFFYMLGSKHNGVYIKGDMIKVDDEEFITVINQLTEYYKTFTQKWSPVISGRSATASNTNTEQQSTTP